jgi:hypothetical protein
MTYYISPPPPNLLSRIVAAIVATVVLIGAFMVGMVALLVVAGAGLVLGIAIWLRVAWIKRQIRKSGVTPGAGINPDATVNTSQESGRVIDAEYTVVRESRDQQDN